jgi:hypothetical protein
MGINQSNEIQGGFLGVENHFEKYVHYRNRNMKKYAVYDERNKFDVGIFNYPDIANYFKFMAPNGYSCFELYANKSFDEIIRLYKTYKANIDDEFKNYFIQDFYRDNCRQMSQKSFKQIQNLIDSKKQELNNWLQNKSEEELEEILNIIDQPYVMTVHVPEYLRNEWKQMINGHITAPVTTEAEAIQIRNNAMQMLTKKQKLIYYIICGRSHRFINFQEYYIKIFEKMGEILDPQSDVCISVQYKDFVSPHHEIY